MAYPTPAGLPVVFEKFLDTGDDLLYNILLALGGTMADVKQIFKDTTDDLLYAILLRLDGTVTIDPGDGSFDASGRISALTCYSEQPQILNFGTAPGLDDLAAGIVIVPEVFYDVNFGLTNPTGTIWYVTGNNDLTIKIRR
jgi:hypothetical protein